MKAIKVSIVINNRQVFSSYFTNYPTFEELLSHIPSTHRGNFDVCAFVQALHPKRWCICYEPCKVIQFVTNFGVSIGRIEMEEVLIFDCVGFDPTRTESELAKGYRKNKPGISKRVSKE
jgi:hypothetical protein